jgi:hypothetical protein
MKNDKRAPKLESVGCYSWNSKNLGEQSFWLGKDFKVQNGQVFVYNKGVLFLLKEEAKE